jgi:hypothetical protein
MKVTRNLTLGLERPTTIHTSTNSIVSGVNARVAIWATTTQQASITSATCAVVAR